MANPIFTLAPLPHWVVVDNFSRLPPGAAIYTYSTLNPSQFKPAYKDSAGNFPYSQPIDGFGNGTFPPIYWEFDANNPDDTYYIEAYTARKENGGLFLWSLDGLSGGGSGGGGGGTTANDIENLVINNIFYRNIGNVTGTPSLPSNLVIAPGAHEGFVDDSDTTNINIRDHGPVAPDIIFAKNYNATTPSSDNISFHPFTPLGITALPIADPTPQTYIEYQCTANPPGAEVYKYFQFPISQGVASLAGAVVSVRIYGFAGSSGSSNQITLNWRQFFGSGVGASPDVITPIAPAISLNTSWTVYEFVSVTIPSVSGKTLGSSGMCQNDGLFLQVALPLSPASCDINFTKPQVYLGPILPLSQYDTNDVIDSLINTPRTGDIRTSLNAFMPGWVIMNDGTIGNASSNATARANNDTFSLFSLLWNTFKNNPTLAPMYSSTGAPVSAYGGSPTADYIANNQISLTRNLGRVMAGALPLQVSQSFTNSGNVLTVASTASFITGVPITVSGASLPTPLAANTVYYAIMLSSTTLALASTPENAITGAQLTLTSNSSGTVTVSAYALGSFLGETTHTLLTAEMPNHSHTIPGLIQNYAGVGASSTYNTTGPPGTTPTSSIGGGSAFSIMQPTVFMNVFIKL